MKKYIIISLIVLFICNINTSFASDASDLVAAEAKLEANKYKLLETIPGASIANKSTTFPEYVTGIYKFAIVIVAIAALLMLSIGGFAYMASAGNQAQAGTAKKIITDALLGLIVVFLSWLVLYTINPDLLGADPGMGNLNVGVKQNNTPPGRSPQKDVHCKIDGTGCKNTLAECETAHGEGVCVKKSDAIDKTKTYGMNVAGGDVSAYDSPEECYAYGEIYCIGGREYANSMVYGIDNLQNELKLNEDGTVDTMFGADVSSLSDESIEQLKMIPGKEYKNWTLTGGGSGFSFTEDKTIGNILVTGVEIIGAEEGGKKITLARQGAKELEEYIQDHNDSKHVFMKDGAGNNYYLLYKDSNDELYGYIASSTAGVVILPKNDGTPYTIGELEKMGLRDAHPDS